MAIGEPRPVISCMAYQRLSARKIHFATDSVTFTVTLDLRKVNLGVVQEIDLWDMGVGGQDA